MPLFFEKFDNTNPDHHAAAQEISGWTQGAHMLPLTPEKMAAHVLGLLAYEVNIPELPKVAGYRAVTETYVDQEVYEIGALVVNPTMRGKGYGSEIANELVDVAQAVFPQATLLAFCNPHSAPISLARGFTEVTDPKEVPRQALALCQGCPKFAALPVGTVCCDTILQLQPGAPGAKPSCQPPQ